VALREVTKDVTFGIKFVRLGATDCFGSRKYSA